MPRSALTVLFLLSGGLLAAPPGAPTPTATLLQPPTPPALSGPRVIESPRSTLVERDFSGRVVRLSDPPEQVAAAALELSQDVRVRVDAIIARRVRLLDAFIAENLDLVSSFGAAVAAGDPADVAQLGVEAFKKLAPLREGGTFEQQIQREIPPEQSGRFNALVREYWDAIVAERRAAEKEAERAARAVARQAARNGQRVEPKNVEKKPEWAIVLEEKLQSLGREIETGVQRLVYSGELIYRYLTLGMTLRPEQQEDIRSVCIDYAQAAGDQPTKWQQIQFVLVILSHLDREQQAQFIKRLREMS
ncbi:MAG: hypothetical protein JNM07_03745 [Phycisphaerae bacterium]|nr:hypothetical protein [Phycisphaerae bacterium]